MVKLFKKINRSLALVCFSLIFLSSNAIATCFTLPNPCLCGKFYAGGFGGIGYSDNINLTQAGTVFFPGINSGSLAVYAKGRSNSTSARSWGLQAGYRWNGWQFCDGNILLPAVEIEGYYLGPTSQRGDLINQTASAAENSYQDVFPLHTGVFMVNSILSFKVPSFNCFYPYIGGGVGTASVTISGANSTQLAPAEPHINHFNSSTSASAQTFAAQGKVGFRIDMSKHWKLITEYRFLYLSPTRYTFGSTRYSTHAPTTKWNINIANMKYNMGIVGIEYDF